MSRAYSDLAFSPTVRAVQTRLGSRAAYAFLDRSEDRGDRLTSRERGFIEARDSFYQATVGETGWPYVQHRGGPAGFLRVLDERTLAFADFSGNRQYISVGNLVGNDRIALILMDYAEQRRLKLLGRVRLVDRDEDPELIERLHTPGTDAVIDRAFVIHVEGFDWNCPQHITPRFTEAQVHDLLAPLRARLQQAQQQLQQQAQRQGTAPARDAVAVALGSGGAGVHAFGDGPLALRVTGIRQLTDRVRAYRLESADGAALPAVAAGAHVELPVRGPDRLGREAEMLRAYSIASDPGDSFAWEVAVLREDDGQGGSAAIHAHYTLGTVLHVQAPGNHFALHEDARPAALLAGGIGITPLRGMAHALQARGSAFTLDHAVRSLAQAPYRAELAQTFGAAVRWHAADRAGRLDIPAAVQAAARHGAVVYACGPARFLHAVQQAAQACGLPPEQVRMESFG